MLKIQGGQLLSGSVNISGAKNAVAPIIGGALLFDEVVLHNVPRIGDVFNLLDIIRTIGMDVQFE